MKSDQEFLADQTRESVGAPDPGQRQEEQPALSSTAAPAAAVKNPPPIATAPKESNLSRSAPKAKATPTPSSRLASRKRELPPESTGEVTVVPDYADDPRDQDWDRNRDQDYRFRHDRDADFDRDRDDDWDRNRDRDFDRRHDEWADRPHRRSESVRFSPEDELPRKVQHIRRFIHRLLPF
jgi:hypothetical protein